MQDEVDGIYWQSSLIALRLALPVYGRLALLLHEDM
jgi:hypothetical protein